MKTGSIAFVRELRQGDTGTDCRAVKRALAKAGHGAGMNLSTNTFAAAAIANLEAFRLQHKLGRQPVYDAKTHRALTPFFDEFGASLLAKEAVLVAQQRNRANYVTTWDWMIAHRSLFEYAEVRPIPEHLPARETSARIVTDCSGSVELAAVWCKLPDPSGLAFNGEGNTGTLLAHCRHITVAQVRPADLCVYRRSASDGYGHHVAVVLERLSATDFEMGSHGHPGTPERITHSAMAAAQARAGYPAFQFLQFLP